MDETHSIDTELSREEVLEALAQASETWGANWEPQGSEGRLELPVLAGLRHGLLAGSVRIEPLTNGSRVVLRVDSSHYRLHWSALAILVLGAAGGIAATLWPFYPPLLGIAPVAIVVALAAWILVASRLRTSTPDDFLEFMASHGGAPGIHEQEA